MRKGFSIEVFDNKILCDCRFESDVFDNVIIEDTEYFIGIEGVILNKRRLLKQYAGSDFNSLIRQLYAIQKEKIFAILEGEFSGFILHKETNIVKVFTNITSTQKVFYYNYNNLFLAETSLKSLAEKLKAHKRKISMDLNSIYQILAFTNVLENKTPLENVFKIFDASYIEIDTSNHSLTETKYYDVEWSRFSQDYKIALKKIDEIFSDSVILEYQKDNELQKEHFSLLSGGLDSRMALMYADKLQQHPKKVFCFSQSGYLDEKISKKIAEKYKFDYHFVKLDGGKFLKNIDKMVSMSEGMVIYTGSIHVDYAIRNIETRNIGLVHSGQIGDGVLGGFNRKPYMQKPGKSKILVNADFLPKISEEYDKIVENYEREELFYLRNIAFNRVVLGAQVFQQVSYQTSPFMTKDFLSFAVSLPEAWKYNHRFYLDWIKTYCPEATKFIWERTMMKPNANWKTKVGDQIYKRLYNGFYNKFLGKEDKVSMYPYQHYFSNGAEIQEFYNKYFFDNIHYLDDHKDLKKDIIELYSKKDFISKSNAVNIIAIFKYYSI